MLKISFKGVVFLFFLVCCFGFGRIAEGLEARRLVSSELLEHSKLQVLWQNELPLKRNETLEKLLIAGNRIYAFSDSNYMISLNREKGNMIFARSVAHSGFEVVGLEAYSENGADRLLSLISNDIVVLNAQTGLEVSSKRLGYGIVCPAARNSGYYYVSGADRRIHALRAKDKVQIFEVSADNDSAITSIIADEQFVVFATNAGNLIKITYDGPKKVWQFDAAGAIRGSIVRDGDSLYISSEDTNVYKVDFETGKLKWKYQAEAFLDRNCRAGKRVVYQYIRNKGLVAIDKTSGRRLWQLENGIDLLSEAGDKAYVITKSGTLVVMDNIKKKLLYSVNFAEVSKYVSNLLDSKIYIADEMGRIACLKPAE